MRIDIDDDVAVVTVAVALRSFGLDIKFDPKKHQLRVMRGHAADIGDQRVTKFLAALTASRTEAERHG
jgi:hypothetical protein